MKWHSEHWPLWADCSAFDSPFLWHRMCLFRMYIINLFISFVSVSNSTTLYSVYFVIWWFCSSISSSSIKWFLLNYLVGLDCLPCHTVLLLGAKASVSVCRGDSYFCCLSGTFWLPFNYQIMLLMYFPESVW